MNLLPYFLAEDEQLLIQSPTRRYAVEGPRIYFLPFLHRVLERRQGCSLTANQYAHVANSLTAEVRLVSGPCFFFLGAHETLELLQDCLVLAKDEYVRITNRSTAAERVVWGEATVSLAPFESISENVRKGVMLDSQTACMIRNVKTGIRQLRQGDGICFPKADERFEGVQHKIRLEEHEVVILKDEDGKYHFRHGKDEQSGFFVPSYWELVKCAWSSGLHKDARGLVIERFDLRPKFMWYEFDVRTRDNVELCIKITFFWQILSVATLVKTTDDASGDVCARARSRIIQSVSTVDFADFLSRFNALVHDSVLGSRDEFYLERGIAIHSVEVREIACKDQRTQDILAEIIQETTDRMNRIQKQVSENEISLRRLEGELSAEEAQMKLQEQKLRRLDAQAKAAGEQQALEIKAFMDALGKDVSTDQKLRLYELLRRKETLEAMAKADTKFFLTKEDMEVKIDLHS